MADILEQLKGMVQTQPPDPWRELARHGQATGAAIATGGTIAGEHQRIQDLSSNQQQFQNLSTIAGLEGDIKQRQIQEEQLEISRQNQVLAQAKLDAAVGDDAAGRWIELNEQWGSDPKVHNKALENIMSLGQEPSSYEITEAWMKAAAELGIRPPTTGAGGPMIKLRAPDGTEKTVRRDSALADDLISKDYQIVSQAYEPEARKPVTADDLEDWTTPDGGPVPKDIKTKGDLANARARGEVTTFDTDARSKYKEAEVILQNATESFAAYREVLDRVGPQIIQGKEGDKAELESAYNIFNLQAKGDALLQLGVLTGNDLQVLQAVNPDPTSLAAFIRGGGSLEGAIGQVDSFLRRAGQANYERYGVPGVVGPPPEWLTGETEEAAATPLPPRGTPLSHGQKYTLPDGRSFYWNEETQRLVEEL